MGVRKEELCSSCRNLRFGNTGSTVGVILDLYNAGDARLTRLGENEFLSAVYSVLYDAMDSCFAAQCCQLVRGRLPAHMSGGR